MPLSFATTSPVAVATARILASYLSNHKLSAAEAASLSASITEALSSLASDTAGKNDSSLALAEEPVARRRTKPRSPRRAGTVPAEAAVAVELPAPVPEPAAAFEFGSGAEFAVIAHPETKDSPEPAIEFRHEVDAIGAADAPRKRKRPSRPRSRRGKDAGTAQVSGEMAGQDFAEE